jgi:hypothetical protein
MPLASFLLRALPGLRQRQGEAKAGSSFASSLVPELPAESLYQGLGDREAQPLAFRTWFFPVTPPAGFKERTLVVFGYPVALVAHADQDVILPCLRSQEDLGTGWRIAHGVIHQVAQDLLDSIRVTPHEG